MRRLAAALSALVFTLTAAALLMLWRRRWSSKRPPPRLPISDPPLPKPKELRLRQLLLLLLCSRRRTRVEPASASPPAPDVAQVEQAAPGPEEDVATWRERWFGPISRALYTIDEEASDGEGDEDQEPETPFYTPPSSPPRLSSGLSPAPV